VESLLTVYFTAHRQSLRERALGLQIIDYYLLDVLKREERAVGLTRVYTALFGYKEPLYKKNIYDALSRVITKGLVKEYPKPEGWRLGGRPGQVGGSVGRSWIILPAGRQELVRFQACIEAHARELSATLELQAG
jgi:hypothetical protein